MDMGFSSDKGVIMKDKQGSSCGFLPPLDIVMLAYDTWNYSGLFMAWGQVKIH